MIRSSHLFASIVFFFASNAALAETDCLFIRDSESWLCEGAKAYVAAGPAVAQIVRVMRVRRPDHKIEVADFDTRGQLRNYRVYAMEDVSPHPDCYRDICAGDKVMVDLDGSVIGSGSVIFSRPASVRIAHVDSASARGC